MKKAQKMTKKSKKVMKSDKKVMKKTKKDKKVVKTGHNSFKLSNKIPKIKLSKKQIDMIHQTANALLLYSTKIQASQALNITTTSLQARIERYPMILNEVQSLKVNALKYAKNKIITTAPRAADQLSSLLESENEEMVYKTSNSILEKVGISKPTDTSSSNAFTINIKGVTLDSPKVLEGEEA